MRVARICAAAAVLSAAAAVAFAGWMMTLPREETWFFAPLPFNGPGFVAGCGLLGLVWAATGAVLVGLRPRNALGWLVLAVGVSQAWAVGLTAYGGYGLLEAVPSWAAYVGPALYIPGWLIPPTLLLALYPDGRLPGPRWRWPVLVAAVSIVLLTLCVPSPVVGPAEAGWAMVPRFPDRLADVLVPSKPMYGIRVFVSAIPDAATPVAPSWWAVWTRVGSWVCKPLLLVTVAAGAALDRRPLPGVVAAALVAVALAPARDRLQRAADRLVYGQRRDPLTALTALGQHVALTGQLDLLPGALASVMAAVHAPGAALAAPDGRLVARVGIEPDDDKATAWLPLWFGGQQVGQLRVAPRRRGEAYPHADARLLAALAWQVAVVVRAYELAEALERERDRVLQATTAERDRLRADLHDGLGPSLSGIGLGLQALADSVRDEQSVLPDRIRDEVAIAIADVRSIIDGLRPTALDTMGLPDAIRRHAGTVSAALPIDVVAGDLPTLPPQVENPARLPHHHRGAQQRGPARERQSRAGTAERTRRLAAHQHRRRRPRPARRGRRSGPQLDAPAGRGPRRTAEPGFHPDRHHGHRYQSSSTSPGWASRTRPPAKPKASTSKSPKSSPPVSDCGRARSTMWRR